jgi:low affinity Fe/Cu permease
MAKNKRRRYLVDRSTQWAIVRQSLLHWFYHSLLTVLFLLTLTVLFGGLRPWGETWQALCPLAISVYVSMLLLLPIFIRDSFKLSNRFAGPIYRIRSTLHDVNEGKPYRHIELRKGDFWQGLAQELNAAVETLAKRRAIAAEDFELAVERSDVSRRVADGGPDPHDEFAHDDFHDAEADPVGYHE